MVKTTIKTISFNDELEKKLDEAVENINKHRITGAITKSKLIRVALVEYLQKLDKIKKINEEFADAHKSAEQLLSENGF